MVSGSYVQIYAEISSAVRVIDSPEHDIFDGHKATCQCAQKEEAAPLNSANVLLNCQPLMLEGDTGAVTSLINEETCRTLWRDPPVLEPAMKP